MAAPDSPPNSLYYGDNLDVLRRHVKDESVDLVYLDPPFNSNANYNVLFAAQGRHPSSGADSRVRGHVALGSGGAPPSMRKRSKRAGGRRCPACVPDISRHE